MKPENFALSQLVSSHVNRPAGPVTLLSRTQALLDMPGIDTTSGAVRSVRPYPRMSASCR